MMEKTKHSKAGLLLIELMIAILFFSLTAAMILQIFVKSHTLSQKSEALFQAQNKVSSIAEVMESGGEYEKTLPKYFPELISDSGHSFCGYYDEEWQGTEEEQAVYGLMVSWEDKDDMRQVTIKTFEVEDQNEIYTLPLQFYQQAEKG